MNILIDKTQTGFLSGRYIGENTRLVYDIMAFTEDNQIPGMLMLIDFEKAFDSVAWSFIYKVFNFFGFGENILSWLKILNCEMKASVLQNGFFIWTNRNPAWLSAGGSRCTVYFSIVCGNAINFDKKIMKV